MVGCSCQAVGPDDPLKRGYSDRRQDGGDGEDDDQFNQGESLHSIHDTLLVFSLNPEMVNRRSLPGNLSIAKGFQIAAMA